MNDNSPELKNTQMEITESENPKWNYVILAEENITAIR